MNTIQDKVKKEPAARKPWYRRPTVLLALAGALGGYIYYREIGCRSGTCPITSNPWLTVAWGTAVGYLVGDMIPQKSGGSQTESTEEKTGD